MHAVFHVSGHATLHEKSLRGRTIELSNRLLFVFGHEGVTKVSWGSDTFTTSHYNLSTFGFPRKLAEGVVLLFTFSWESTVRTSQGVSPGLYLGLQQHSPSSRVSVWEPIGAQASGREGRRQQSETHVNKCVSVSGRPRMKRHERE